MKKLKICCLVVATASAQGCDSDRWVGDISEPVPTGGTVTGGAVPAGGSSCDPRLCDTVGSGGTVFGGFVGEWGGGGIFDGTGGSLPETGGMSGGPVAVSWCRAEDGSSRWIYDEGTHVRPGAPCSGVDEDGGMPYWDEDGGL